MTATRTMLALLVGAGAFSLALPTAAAAAISCGDVITQDTTLQNDLDDCPGNGLVIGASGIRLDLAGHRVGGVGVGNGIDNSAGHDLVTITNGTVQGFANGVFLSDASDNRVADLRVSDTTEGIALVSSDDNRIQGNTIAGSAFDGIALLDSHRNRLQDNAASESGDGIFLDSSNGNRIAGNALLDNGFGIDIVFSSDSTIVENVASGNVIGIGRSRDSQIKENVVTGNLLFGIDLFAGSANNVIAENDARENGDGIFVSPSTMGTLIAENDAHRNVDDGVEVRNTATTLRENTANRNGDLGIEAVVGVTDGGGNQARGNGNPAQCTGVTCS